MKPEQFSSTAYSSDGVSLLKWLLLGGAGLLSSSVALTTFPAWASTDGGSEAPVPVESSPSIDPVETSAELLLRPQVTTNPTVEAAPAAPQPSGEAAPVQPPIRLHVTTDETSESAPLIPQTSDESSEPAASSSNDEGLGSVFIDPTDYELGATQSPEGPSLIFSDRSTGCQFTLDQPQSAPNHVCSAQGAELEAAHASTDAQASGGNGLSIGPVSIGGHGVSIGGTTVISREYFNEKLSSLNLLRRGAEEFVFPLAIPSPITSLFGWRTHPIFGDRRFHAGTDLGAPEGTPVVATKDGEVSVADYLGGYGLTVILRHEDNTQETRYAHLSQILVRPGESIKQGEVVGLVGSTGNSTGPHLHFELRELTAHGWVVLNPNELMNLTVANLVDAINNPLQALGLAAGDAETEEALTDMPYRPAQPNAS